MAIALTALTGSFLLVFAACFLLFWMGQVRLPAWKIDLGTTALGAAGLLYAAVLAGPLGWVTVLLCCLGGAAFTGLYRAQKEGLAAYSLLLGVQRKRSIEVALEDARRELDQARTKLRLEEPDGPEISDL
jgi:hypothetical protein